MHTQGRQFESYEQPSLFGDDQRSDYQQPRRLPAHIHHSLDEEGQPQERRVPDESNRLTKAVASSAIPSRDIIDDLSQVTVHTYDHNAWAHMADGDPSAEAGRSFYRPGQALPTAMRPPSVHLAPEADDHTVVHELGHARHYASQRHLGNPADAPVSALSAVSASRKDLIPVTNNEQHPHPIMEGTADGYADRYEGRSNKSPSERAAHRFSQHNSGYTAQYEKSPSDVNQSPWDAHDRIRYAAARQYTGQTGQPLRPGILTTLPLAANSSVAEKRARVLPAAALVETGHAVRQADEAAGTPSPLVREPQRVPELDEAAEQDRHRMNAARAAAVIHPPLSWRHRLQHSLAESDSEDRSKRGLTETEAADARQTTLFSPADNPQAVHPPEHPLRMYTSDNVLDHWSGTTPAASRAWWEPKPLDTATEPPEENYRLSVHVAQEIDRNRPHL